MAVSFNHNGEGRAIARGILSASMQDLYKNGSLDKTAVKVFSSYEEAEAADKKFYRSLSPSQRLEILMFLRAQYSPYSNELTEGFERVCRVVDYACSQDLADREQL